MKYTKKQIEVMRRYLQRFIDIGWNESNDPMLLPICGPGGDVRAAARAHARWLVRRYNAADEGGTWEIV